MPKVRSLRSHLLTELRDLLDAERQLVKVLPSFADGATTPALRVAFQQHLDETRFHLGRLEKVFEVLGQRGAPKRCEGMQGLIREGNAVINSTPPGALRDAVMITSAQKVEHYEMASYGTARTYAQVLGQPEVARLLQDTLDDEKAADAKLTTIAEGKVNETAAQEWHQNQAAAGLLEQTADFAGRAVGIGARTIKRAVDVMGLGKSQTLAASAESAQSGSAVHAHQVKTTAGRSAAAAGRPAKRGTASKRSSRAKTRTRKTTGR
jgi:ferritin-like metal-binding protein YciE